MSDEELLELVGETRNNRIANVNQKRTKKQAKETKVKKKSNKQLSFAEVMAQIDKLSPEQAGAVLTKLQAGGKITESDLETNGESEDSEPEIELE